MLDDIVLFLKTIELGRFRKAVDFSRISLSTMSKQLSDIDINNLLYIDETGVDNNISKLRG